MRGTEKEKNDAEPADEKFDFVPVFRFLPQSVDNRRRNKERPRKRQERQYIGVEPERPFPSERPAYETVKVMLHNEEIEKLGFPQRHRRQPRKNNHGNHQQSPAYVQLCDFTEVPHPPQKNQHRQTGKNHSDQSLRQKPEPHKNIGEKII